MTFFDTTTLRCAEIGEGSVLADVIAARSNIFDMTQQAEEAVLRPRDAGAFDHPLRAAIAARVTAQAGEEALSRHYAQAAGVFADLTQPGSTGTAQGLGAVIAFVDRVANATRDIRAEDITSLQAAGLSDPDIVRLCELVAFLAYQLRVVSGLRLMRGTA